MTYSAFGTDYRVSHGKKNGKSVRLRPGLTSIPINDGWTGSVMNDVVTNTANDGSPDGTQSTGARHDDLRTFVYSCLDNCFARLHSFHFHALSFHLEVTNN